MLTEQQKAEIRRTLLRWDAGPPPCGISSVEIYNPCLPEPDERGLVCLTCGLRQRLPLRS